MSTPKAKVVVIVTLLGASAVVACGSGSGPVIELGQPYENHPGDFAKPGVSNQDPSPAGKASTGGTAATDNPGGTSGTSTVDGGTSGTSGGTSGTSGGTSGSTGGCPPCNGNVACDITVTGGMSQRMTVPLVTKNGACVLVTSSSGGDVTFACGGALMSGGQNVGTWANCTKSMSTTPPTNPDAG